MAGHPALARAMPEAYVQSGVGTTLHFGNGRRLTPVTEVHRITL